MRDRIGTVVGGEEEGEWRDFRERKVKDMRVRIARVSRDPLMLTIEDDDGDICGGLAADIGGAFSRKCDSVDAFIFTTDLAFAYFV